MAQSLIGNIIIWDNFMGYRIFSGHFFVTKYLLQESLLDYNKQDNFTYFIIHQIQIYNVSLCLLIYNKTLSPLLFHYLFLALTFESLQWNFLLNSLWFSCGMFIPKHLSFFQLKLTKSISSCTDFTPHIKLKWKGILLELGSDFTVC